MTNLTKELNACTNDIKTWMTENQLKLNDDKTEALLFPFSSSLKPSTGPLPDSITLGFHNIPFSDSDKQTKGRLFLSFVVVVVVVVAEGIRAEHNFACFAYCQEFLLNSDFCVQSC